VTLETVKTQRVLNYSVQNCTRVGNGWIILQEAGQTSVTIVDRRHSGDCFWGHHMGGEIITAYFNQFQTPFKAEWYHLLQQ
jgi:hypothetical protein